MVKFRWHIYNIILVDALIVVVDWFKHCFYLKSSSTLRDLLCTRWFTSRSILAIFSKNLIYYYSTSLLSTQWTHCLFYFLHYINGIHIHFQPNCGRRLDVDHVRPHEHVVLRKTSTWLISIVGGNAGASSCSFGTLWWGRGWWCYSSLGHRLRQNILVIPDRAYEILEFWGESKGVSFFGVLEGRFPYHFPQPSGYLDIRYFIDWY